QSKPEECQQKRRSAVLEQQKKARFDYVNHARRLAFNELDDSDDAPLSEPETMDTSGSARVRKRTNPYENQLMLSEWLIDRPDDMFDNWLMKPCPEGKRCLVVASKGMTSVYRNNGYRTNQFPSLLPGGSRDSSSGYTILDCIYSQLDKTFYALDMICWNKMTCSDSDTDCRFFLLNSNLTENGNFLETSPHNPYRFVSLPYCNCSGTEAMEEMMKSDFQFPVDGVLFYHKATHYLAGQTPLVTWLLPWMLPEIMGVAVPEKYTKGHENQTAAQFRSDFETKRRGGRRSNLYQQPKEPTNEEEAVEVD
uniref:Snurportin-1 n=1 Tax=Plectus sambesii TaxID=2011161 RepID=A0A914X1C4_9BILA